jgi:hypothetical protein
MKYFLILLFLGASITIFAQTNIDGNWKGTRETPNGTFEVNYTFKVDGKTLAGMLKGQFGETKLENGKIDSNKISYSVTFNGTTIDSTGEILNENEILVKNQFGEMKLTRVKSWLFQRRLARIELQSLRVFQMFFNKKKLFVECFSIF